MVHLRSFTGRKGASRADAAGLQLRHQVHLEGGLPFQEYHHPRSGHGDIQEHGKTSMLTEND